jgi:hypothetical protein
MALPFGTLRRNTISIQLFTLSMTQLVRHGPPQQQICFIGRSRSFKKLPYEIVVAQGSKVSVGVAHVLPIVSYALTHHPRNSGPRNDDSLSAGQLGWPTHHTDPHKLESFRVQISTVFIIICVYTSRSAKTYLRLRAILQDYMNSKNTELGEGRGGGYSSSCSWRTISK